MVFIVLVQGGRSSPMQGFLLDRTINRSFGNSVLDHIQVPEYSL